MKTDLKLKVKTKKKAVYYDSTACILIKFGT